MGSRNRQRAENCHYVMTNATPLTFNLRDEMVVHGLAIPRCVIISEHVKHTPVINVIVNCTARKTLRDCDAFMRNVTKCSLDARLKQWIHCLSRDSSKAIPALDLYCGDSWANILKGIESPRLKVCCNLWIASAGYGLVSSSDNLVCYSATFTSGSEDSVLAGDCPKFNSLDWWTAIC